MSMPDDRLRKLRWDEGLKLFIGDVQTDFAGLIDIYFMGVREHGEPTSAQFASASHLAKLPKSMKPQMLDQLRNYIKLMQIVLDPDFDDVDFRIYRMVVPPLDGIQSRIGFFVASSDVDEEHDIAFFVRDDTVACCHGDDPYQSYELNEVVDLVI